MAIITLATWLDQLTVPTPRTTSEKRRPVMSVSTCKLYQLSVSLESRNQKNTYHYCQQVKLSVSGELLNCMRKTSKPIGYNIDFPRNRLRFR
jgi:hypothetical protein